MPIGGGAGGAPRAAGGPVSSASAGARPGRHDAHLTSPTSRLALLPPHSPPAHGPQQGGLRSWRHPPLATAAALDHSRAVHRCTFPYCRSFPPCRSWATPSCIPPPPSTSSTPCPRWVPVQGVGLPPPPPVLTQLGPAVALCAAHAPAHGARTPHTCGAPRPYVDCCNCLPLAFCCCCQRGKCTLWLVCGTFGLPGSNASAASRHGA